MVIVAFAVFPLPLRHVPGTLVVLAFSQVMLFCTEGPDVNHSSVTGWLEYPVVQLKFNVAFMVTWSMLHVGPAVMLTESPVTSDVPCGWTTFM